MVMPKGMTKHMITFMKLNIDKVFHMVFQHIITLMERLLFVILSTEKEKVLQHTEKIKMDTLKDWFIKMVKEFEDRNYNYSEIFNNVIKRFNFIIFFL